MDIRTLCLGILSRQEATGYEIRKLFQGPISEFFEASFGSIYPALSKLQSEGLIEGRAQAQDKRPDKKIYRITPKGRLALIKALEDTPGPDRVRSEFVATMLFADLMQPRHVSRLIDERLAMHDIAIEALVNDSEHQLGPTAGGDFMRGLGLAIHRAARAYLEDNRHLVESEALLAKLDVKKTAGRGKGG